jgi:hypothetical protein
MLTVNVTSQNDYPVVFLAQYGTSVLLGDPSEPVIVSLLKLCKVSLISKFGIDIFEPRKRAIHLIKWSFKNR